MPDGTTQDTVLATLHRRTVLVRVVHCRHRCRCRLTMLLLLLLMLQPVMPLQWFAAPAATTCDRNAVLLLLPPLLTTTKPVLIGSVPKTNKGTTTTAQTELARTHTHTQRKTLLFWTTGKHNTRVNHTIARFSPHRTTQHAFPTFPNDYRDFILFSRWPGTRPFMKTSQKGRITGRLLYEKRITFVSSSGDTNA